MLLTGHTGFKGAWLQAWLRTLGARVTGYALAPSARPNLWELLHDEGTTSVIGDIRDADRVRATMAESRPQIVIHMAAQALVRESYRAPLDTYATNVLGTANLLDACRSSPGIEGVIVVTSDKVYENDGAGRPFAEPDRLGGHDPYSSSKACAELVTNCYRESFFPHGPPLAAVRAGNVIGGGDWSADRLVPDCVRALQSGTRVRLRYPQAVRPWQHVLEPLCGYLTTARALVETPASAPRAVNFGPDPASFRSVAQVVDAFSARFDGRPGWERDGGSHPPEASALTLSSTLAEQTLDWRPVLNVEESLSWTADWYRAHTEGRDMREVTQAQIDAFQRRAAPEPRP